jgi:DNA-binding NarL/FixJ family response regulator
MPIHVSIVEDDRYTRESLVALLTDSSLLGRIRAYASAEEAIKAMPQEPPDVALVDINLPGMNGIACVERLKRALPALQILMLTTYEESELIFESLRAGASGYLLKKTIPRQLVTAIEELHAGGAPMSMSIARKVVEHFRPDHRRTSSEVDALTPREQEILALLAEGCLYKEIADRLAITLGTVRTHMQHIYEKLHVQSRTAATLKFLQR